MVRQALNYGSFEDDPSAENAYWGFRKIDGNFIESFEALTALPNYAEKLDSLRAAGVPDRVNLLLDFIDNLIFVRNNFIGASVATLIAAMPAATFTRASIATYVDSDGLMKTAAAGIPRIDYDPLTLQPRGLLYESQSVNLCLRSQELENATWVKTGASVVANTSIAPDGTTTVDKLVEDMTNGPHYNAQVVNVTAGNTYTLSRYVREPSGNVSKRFFALLLASSGWGSNLYAVFDVGAGTVTQVSAGATASIVPAGNGFFRCSITAAATLTASTSFQMRIQNASTGVPSYTGDGTSGMEQWGGQFEVNNVASSYIPTTTAATSRATEQMTLEVPSLINQAEGTLAMELEDVGGTSSSYLDFQLTEAANTDRLILRRGMTGGGFFYVFRGGAQQGSPGIGSFGAGVGRVAARYKAGDHAGSVNGAAPTKNNDPDIPLAIMTRAYVYPGANTVTRIRRLMYFPTALSDAKLQSLSNLSAWN